MRTWLATAQTHPHTLRALTNLPVPVRSYLFSRRHLQVFCIQISRLRLDGAVFRRPSCVVNALSDASLLFAWYCHTNTCQDHSEGRIFCHFLLFMARLLGPHGPAPSLNQVHCRAPVEAHGCDQRRNAVIQRMLRLPVEVCWHSDLGLANARSRYN